MWVGEREYKCVCEDEIEYYFCVVAIVGISHSIFSQYDI